MSTAAGESPVPDQLRVHSGGDQFTVTDARPRLSWQLPGVADIGGDAELEASVDGSVQRTMVTGGAHLFVPWPFPPLRSRQEVRWRVRLAGAGAPGDWSSWSSFEAGLLDHDWQARWISPQEGADPGWGRRPAYHLSVSFDLPVVVTRARLYATALGVYEASVNGVRAGAAELLPGSTSYAETLYAQAFDVTAAVHQGGNLLEIVLSDGWYRGQVGAFRVPAGWGSMLAARAELHLDLADGGTMHVHTDESWRCTTSTIVAADLMDGQSTDFTATPSPDLSVLVDQVQAPQISWSPAPPVRVVETRRPVTSTKLSDSTWIVDFGQNASGRVRLTGLGPRGTRTVLDHGEHVGPDGDLDTSHLDSKRPGEDARPFRQQDVVIAGGTAEVFEPHHTVHGFRYVRVEREGAQFDPDTIEMQVLQTDLHRTGTFACSDPDLTRLHEIADWSFRGNAVDVPTDCPTRERLAWTGDYQVFAPTATRLYDVLGFSRKWLQSVRDDQLEDGRIPNFAPDGRRIKHNLDDQLAMMTGSAGWGDAIVAVPWELYTAYGDTEVLAECWIAMVRWVDWALRSARTARHPSRIQRSEQPLPHEQFLWDGSFHWGEWTEPKQKTEDGSRIDPIQDDPMAWFMSDKGEVGTAYLYRSTATLGRIAEILGHTAEAHHYAALAEKIRSAWQTEFLSDDGRTLDDSQASYVRALDFGLLPEDRRPAAAARLVELIRRAGTHLTTGFLSTGQLLPVLADHGHADVAYGLLFQRTPPSWLYMLDQGATTIWEDWEGIDEQGHAHDSLNHYSKGSVIRFLHTHTLGLRQNAGSSAWRSFTIRPVPHPTLSWARGNHESPLGGIEVEWRREGEQLVLAATVPAGTVASVELPGCVPERVEGPATVHRTASAWPAAG